MLFSLSRNTYITSLIHFTAYELPAFIRPERMRMTYTSLSAGWRRDVYVLFVCNYSSHTNLTWLSICGFQSFCRSEKKKPLHWAACLTLQWRGVAMAAVIGYFLYSFGSEDKYTDMWKEVNTFLLLSYMWIVCGQEIPNNKHQMTNNNQYKNHNFQTHLTRFRSWNL